MLKKLFSCLLILFVSVSVLTGGLIEVDAEDSGSYGITLDQDEIILIEGDSAQITATVVPEDLEITWSSQNESAVTVDQTGKITGIKAVNTAVAVIARSKDGKYKATCWVYVVKETRATGQCGEKAFWELTWRGVLTISGEGRVSGHGKVSESGEWTYSGSVDDFVWEKYGPDVKTIIINDGITRIPDYTFSSAFWYPGWDYNEVEWCDEYFFRNLKSISIPQSVTNIGTYGFSYLFNLENVYIDENNPAYCADDHFVYTKDQETIIRAFGLQEEFVIPEGVGYLEEDAFGDLQNLTTIQFPSTIIRIGPYITDGAKNFTTVKGYENTVAKEFADEYGYEFISLGICELPEISEIVLNKTSMELIMGNTEKLTASVMPENADTASLYWSSSDPSVATVDEEGNVTGADVGTAVITITADNGVSASCNVKVYNPDYPDELTLNRTSLALLPGKSFRLTANGYERVIPLTWTSSDPDVATVSSNGAVLAKAPGNTVITATGGGLSASCELRVLFTDVAEETQYFYEPVYWALDNEITVGAGGPGKFSPAASCTREQFVTFLWRMEGKPEPEEGCTFSDVPESAWYYKSISWAAEKGITTGLNDGTNRFGVGQACTREQCVTFLHRAAGSPEPEGSIEFTDSPEGRYYYKAIKWAASKGITVGLNDGTGRFGVGQKCTRGMLVTFLYRYAHAE